MKEYCVDLEIAKELKENGFPQINGLLYLYDNNDLTTFEYQNEILGTDNAENLEIQGLFRSPTSDEILPELPNEIEDPSIKCFYHLKIEKSPINDERYFVSYGITNKDRAWMEQYYTNDKKLSNALAKMWLCINKEGYIK